MSVVLGFDFGMKYIGVAVGQSLTQSATPITSLLARDGIPNWQEIENMIQNWRPHALIVGIPLNMDSTEQPITFAARKFANRLEVRFKLPVYRVDERLSTWEAKHRIGPKKNKKQQIKEVNAMAAVVLVEQWLNS
jgi:putative Holliday junction resolvase